MKSRMLLGASFLGFAILSIGCGSSSQTGATFSSAAARATPEPIYGLSQSGKNEAAPADFFAPTNTEGLVVGSGAVTISGASKMAGGTLNLNSSSFATGDSVMISGGTFRAGFDEGPQAKPGLEPTQRKIVQTATLDIIVADFDKARADLLKLIEEYKGYVAKSDVSGNAKSDVSGSAGSKHTGMWIVRIPVERFQAFASAVAALGQPQRQGTSAQDVTEECVDLQADIKNLKEKETKLNELMKAKAQSLQDVVLWEKEVSSVRGEIARKEARQETLSRLTAMSTANITLREEKESTPPPAPAPSVPAPPTGSSVSRTFWASIDALEESGHFLLITLVALAPWSPLIVVLILLVRILLRHIPVDYFRSDSDDNDTSPPPRDQAQPVQG